MQSLPADFGALCALVLLLGLRHGFDADHLATIDALTRWNARRSRGFAPWCGLLFSLGHGAVVLVVAALAAWAGSRWQVPRWLEWGGVGLSFACLVLLGVMNLRAVLASGPGEVVAPVGLKGRWIGSLGRAARPWTVLAVGALFAASFDTVSLAALFALAGLHAGGWAAALGLALLFAAGMVATDALGGLWIARLVARADQLAVVASRVMSLAVAATSLLVAGLGAARAVLPALDGQLARRELLPGALVCALMAGSYAVARRLARSRPQPA